MAVTPDATATIIYTSGTTGRPKGCVITHANFMAEADNMVMRYETVFPSKPGDEASTLLFLPLAHVFGRMVQVAAIRGRVKLAHQPELAARALLPDLQSFQPTFILAVPYIFEKVFAASRRKAEAEGKEGPFDKAVEIAVRYAEAQENKAFGTGSGPERRTADAASALRQARLQQGPCGDGRPGAACDVRRLGDGAPARAVLRRRRSADLRGLRPDGEHRGRHRQPARADPLRHRRHPCPRHHGAHRGGQ